jgi:beta-barrel assembly-enhancing protease
LGVRGSAEIKQTLAITVFIETLASNRADQGGSMSDRDLRKSFLAAFLAAAVWVVPMGVLAQTTQIKQPSNRYKVEDDIRLGNQAATEVERQFPILNDWEATEYVSRVGERLVAAIPPQFRQPAFDYRFKVVNARDINAFALPGGPMYVNRGMIQAARTEGEMAGVMAHEIAHIALRHATAQATKQGSAKNTLGTLGMILGGAILGGQTGAQLGMMGAQVWQTRYSRDYETQADILGAHIMANAGYHPRDLANMFRTIAQESGGGRGPEWLSSHPDPGNRYDRINREAQYLRVSNPIQYSPDFERIKARLSGMGQAPTMAEIERGARTGGAGSRTAGGRYSSRVPAPSRSYRTYSGTNWMRISVPSNWRDFSTSNDVQFAPEGAYGDQGITHGAMIGIYRGQYGDLQNNTRAYIQELLQGNPNFRQDSNFSRTMLGNRQGLVTTLSGRSPVTGRTELVTVYTTNLRSGDLFHIITVVPEDESYAYQSTFNTMIRSLQLAD